MTWGGAKSVEGEAESVEKRRREMGERQKALERGTALKTRDTKGQGRGMQEEDAALSSTTGWG